MTSNSNEMSLKNKLVIKFGRLLGVLILVIMTLFCLSGCFLNMSPKATFTASPGQGEAPLKVHFDASDSSDFDGRIRSYKWTFGDGSTGRGVSVTHTFNSEGHYVVQLTITDNGGASDCTLLIISVREPGEERRLKILNWSLDESEYGDAEVEGEVKNVSNHTIDRAEIIAKFYNSRCNRIEMESEIVEDLGSGVVTEFKIQPFLEYDKVNLAAVYANVPRYVPW